jgi:hypothetical protein
VRGILVEVDDVGLADGAERGRGRDRRETLLAAVGVDEADQLRRLGGAARVDSAGRLGGGVASGCVVVVVVVVVVSPVVVVVVSPVVVVVVVSPVVVVVVVSPVVVVVVAVAPVVSVSPPSSPAQASGSARSEVRRARGAADMRRWYQGVMPATAALDGGQRP